VIVALIYLRSVDASGAWIVAFWPRSTCRSWAVISAALMSVGDGLASRSPAPRPPVQGRHRRTPFGWFIHLLVGNPVMPLVVIAGVIGLRVQRVGLPISAPTTIGVEFFVETEPEQAIVYVRARGNLSIEEMDALVPRPRRSC
jgi:multidrug efflux pump